MLAMGFVAILAAAAPSHGQTAIAQSDRAFDIDKAPRAEWGIATSIGGNPGYGSKFVDANGLYSFLLPVSWSSTQGSGVMLFRGTVAGQMVICSVVTRDPVVPVKSLADYQAQPEANIRAAHEAYTLANLGTRRGWNGIERRSLITLGDGGWPKRTPVKAVSWGATGRNGQDTVAVVETPAKTLYIVCNSATARAGELTIAVAFRLAEGALVPAVGTASRAIASARPLPPARQPATSPPPLRPAPAPAGPPPAGPTPTPTIGHISPEELTGKMDIGPGSCIDGNSDETYRHVRLKAFRDPATGKCGFKDNDGRIIIPARFGRVYEFGQGVAIVSNGRGWGMIDEGGRILLPMEYSLVRPFTNGLARVNRGGNDLGQGGKWGFADLLGRLVIPVQHDSAGEFSEGLAPVSLGGKCGYIDSQGRTAIPFQFAECGSFGDGLAPFTREGMLNGGGKIGFIDKQGKVVISPAYLITSGFSEGLAAVSVTGSSYGYIDKSGKERILPIFTQAGPFRNGRAFVRTRRGVDLFINTDGLPLRR